MDREFIKRLRAGLQRNYEYILLPLGLLLFLLLWQRISVFYESFILPSPGEVWRRFLELTQRSGVLKGHLLVTLSEALGGFLLATIIALPLSYFLARHPFLERLFTPYIVGFQAIPIVALAPLLVIWFGFGLTSKVLVSALTAFFPIVTNGIVGLRGTDLRLKELMAIMGADQREIFLKLEAPSALPVIFGGLRLGMTFSVIGAVVGEFAGAGKGLGYLVNFARGTLDTPLLFVGLIILALFGVNFYLLLSLVEYLVMPWRRKGR